MLVAYYDEVEPRFVLEGSTAGYEQEDHQLSPHTQTYLHTAVQEPPSHHTIMYLLPSPRWLSPFLLSSLK